MSTTADPKALVPPSPDAEFPDDSGMLEFDDQPAPVLDDEQQSVALSDSHSIAPSLESDTKKRKAPTKRRKSKRRRIVVDAPNSMLSGAEMSKFLEDTSKIVLPPRIGYRERSNRELLRTLKPLERIARPALGDDGNLAPTLLRLWEQNNAKVLGGKSPYRYLETEEPRAEEATEEIEEEEEEDLFPEADNGVDLDEEMPPPDEEFPDAPAALDDDSDTQSVLSLGGTNMQYEALDTDTVQTKWHKNTVQVLGVLKHNLEQTDTVDFGKLSQKVSRRTAAGLFFEVLNLKTMDYIDVDQDGGFAPIKISAGPRFQEAPPQ